MASNYPAGLDDLDEASNPGLTHGDISSSIEAIQAALGINLKNVFPVGLIVPTARTTIPSLWLPCDGTARDRLSFPDLFNAMGGTNSPYGLPNGTQFSLPNLAGKFPLGVGGAYLMGAEGGAATVVIGTTNLPPHAHTIAHTHDLSNHTHDVSHGHTGGTYGASYLFPTTPPTRNVAKGPSPLESVAGLPTNADHSHGIAVDTNWFSSGGPSNNATGGSSAANSGNGPGTSVAVDKMNPYQVVRYMVYAGA